MHERTHHVSGATILIVEPDAFVGGYIRIVLDAARTAVIGPIGSIAEASALVDAGAAVDGVVLSCELSTADHHRWAEALRRNGIPHVFTRVRSPATSLISSSGAPVLNWPFAAYQVVGALAELIGGTSKPDRSAAVPIGLDPAVQAAQIGRHIPVTRDVGT